MNLKREKLSEKIIINNFLKKLNSNRQGTFNFENDAAYLKLPSYKHKFSVTTDTILEDTDFFKNDNPKSIAQKIMTINLSDTFAMGANPHSYVLNLCLPSYINREWLNIFSKQLKVIQKKYNIYLLGGDLSKSNKLIISGTFFGFLNKNLTVFQNKINIDDDIWITGKIGDSKIGLDILKKNIFVNKKFKNYFTKKYLYPQPCPIGPKLSKYCSSMKDISDGFVGDLKKILNNNAGAFIKTSNIPISTYAKKILSTKHFKFEDIIDAGDDYGLIIIAKDKYRTKIKKICQKNKIKISLVGKIVRKKGIHFDSQLSIDNFKYFDHFS